jgi:membrane protein implicated in regulation of membrane protease activity
MDAARTGAIIVIAIVAAIVAIKLLTFVLSLIWTVVMIAFFAAVLYVCFLIAKNALRRKTPAKQQ